MIWTESTGEDDVGNVVPVHILCSDDDVVAHLWFGKNQAGVELWGCMLFLAAGVTTFGCSVPDLETVKALAERRYCQAIGILSH